MIHMNLKLENLLHMHYPSCPTSAGDTRRRQINKSFPLNQVDRCLWLHRMDVRGVRRAADSKGGNGQYIWLELNHHARLVVGLYWSTSSIKSNRRLVDLHCTSTLSAYTSQSTEHSRSIVFMVEMDNSADPTTVSTLLYSKCTLYAPTKLSELEISCRS